MCGRTWVWIGGAAGLLSDAGRANRHAVRGGVARAFTANSARVIDADLPAPAVAIGRAARRATLDVRDTGVGAGRRLDTNTSRAVRAGDVPSPRAAVAAVCAHRAGGGALSVGEAFAGVAHGVGAAAGARRRVGAGHPGLAAAGAALRGARRTAALPGARVATGDPGLTAARTARRRPRPTRRRPHRRRAAAHRLGRRTRRTPQPQHTGG
jgi:hypothetical protein